MNPSTFSRALTNVQRFALFTAALCLAASTSCAADTSQTGSSAQATQSQSTSSDLDNIGFIKNPPKALTDRFPMCDAFLKVEWIDKKKKIGYAHYKAQVYNVHGKLSKEKKSVWALVKLADSWASYSLDTYPFVRQGNTKKLFDLVRNGKELKDTGAFQIKYKGNINVFYDLKTVLSGHRQTVCLTYPDEQSAWIIEAKDVKRAYNKAQKDMLLKKISESWPSIGRDSLGELWILDINFDSKDDYFYGPEKVIGYSLNDKIYLVDFSVSYPDFILTFPPKNKTCHLKIGRAFPLTTDGKSYFIRKCNITEPTSLVGKE